MKKLTRIGHDIHLHVMQEKRLVFFHEEVARHTIEYTIKQLEYLNGLNSKPITLRICSPGGAVDHGLALYDYIKSSKAPIYTLCSGYAASMGAVLLGSGKKGKRFVTKNARIMIHQPSSGFAGKASDMEIHVKETLRIKKLLNELLSKDTGTAFNKVAKDTELDYWMTAEEALKYGLVDKII